MDDFPVNMAAFISARGEKQRRDIGRARNQIAKEGILSLRSFIKLGWRQLEPSRPFVDGWHLGVLSEHLTAISDNQLNRIIFNVPPGTMKSLMCSVFWNAWEWGPRGMPSMRFIGFSYDKELSTRDALRTRRLIQSKWYHTLWGSLFNLVVDQNVKTRFENNQTGFRISDYVGGGTGDRGDRDVVDDPHNVKDGESEVKREAALLWLSETLPTRVNDPEKSAIVIIQQRIGERDISGEALSKDLGYYYVMLPMEYEVQRCCYTPLKKKGEQPRTMRFLHEEHIWLPNDWRPQTNQDKLVLFNQFTQAKPQQVYKWDQRTAEGELLFPERFPKFVVERDKKAMTPFAVAAQFQQRPTVRGGSMIQRHWFEIVNAIPADCYYVRWFDLAATFGAGDYTAGVLMGRSRSNSGMFYIRDVVRAQLDGDGVKKLIRQTAAVDQLAVGKRNYSIWIPQDPGQAGKVQARDFINMLAGYDVHSELESGDKMTRAQPFAAQAEAGNVKLLSAMWNEPFLHECASFSEGAKYKDQVDACSGAFGTLIMHPKQQLIVGALRGQT